MTATPLTVAILAGGEAKRLSGRDKGLEPLRGRPLIEWVIAAVREMDPASELLIVANRNHAEYARNAPTIADSRPGFPGPLAGVASALAHCATPLLLTVPVDCPDPPRDLAVRLEAALITHDAVVAHDGELRQPLFALYRRTLAESAARAAEAGQGVWQWQTSVGALELDFSDRRRQFQNLNTAEDFAAYAAEHGSEA